MTRILSIAIASIGMHIANAQTVAISFSKKDKVEINKWDARGVFFLSGYWEMAKPQLAKKFSSNLVDSIVNYSSANTYPDGLTEFLSKDDEISVSIKNKLKVYLVGQFDNNTNGTFYGIEYVLWLPKEENKNWKAEIVWEHDVFIIIPKNAIAKPR